MIEVAIKAARKAGVVSDFDGGNDFLHPVNIIAGNRTVYEALRGKIRNYIWH